MRRITVKKLSAIMLSLVFLLCGCSSAPKDTPLGTNAEYDVLGLGNIAVGMWVTPTDAYRTEEQFKLLSESGINVVNGFCYSEDTDEKVHSSGSNIFTVRFQSRKTYAPIKTRPTKSLLAPLWSR